MILVEACVADLDDAVRAAAAGAGRLELCADLDAGGTTPDPALLGAVRGAVTIPLHVMVRPRPGGFHYTVAELVRMGEMVRQARTLGADGVVLGVLDSTGRVNREALRELLDATRPLSVTFHRAIDAVPDPLEALDTLVELGLDRVLSSGSAPTAQAGIPVLKALVNRAAGRLTVMAGGGIRSENVARIVRETGVREVHLQAGPRAAWLEGVVGELRVES